jgi:alkylation response protein AidB-like acyl-CoA dehydrogenase
VVDSVLNDLETVFGDPFDPGNPLGHNAILAADESGELLAAGESALRGWQANAEFVPTELGGRLATVDGLVRRLRPVFRRDAALGLGYGVTSLMAALNVWLGGAEAQRKQLADTLLGGERVCVAYHELAHGNDVTANEMRAARRHMSLVLDGRKEVINNADRADHAVVFARTDERTGGRSHSLLLVDLTELPADRWRRLPRYRTMGLRGCHLAGLEFNGCPAPEGTLVGDVGAGADIALRSFQVSRCVTAGLGVGVLDAALFTVLRFARSRRLYGRTVAEIPHARSTMAGAFTDLLVADALSTVAARSIHLLPANGAVYAAATKYLVPLLLEQAMDELAVVLGARFYLREGDSAIFGKHFRDLPALSIGHAGGVSCQLTVLPQLPALCRSLERAQPAPAALFDGTAELPGLALTSLRLRRPGRRHQGAGHRTAGRTGRTAPGRGSHATEGAGCAGRSGRPRADRPVRGRAGGRRLPGHLAARPPPPDFRGHVVDPVGTAPTAGQVPPWRGRAARLPGRGPVHRADRTGHERPRLLPGRCAGAPTRPGLR